MSTSTGLVAKTMVETECVLRRAGASDAAAIAAVVNAANSGDGGMAGWTHEGGLFEGRRTDVGEVLDLLAVPGATFVLCLDGREIVGCAYLKQIRSAAYMGLLPCARCCRRVAWGVPSSRNASAWPATRGSAPRC